MPQEGGASQTRDRADTHVRRLWPQGAPTRAPALHGANGALTAGRGPGRGVYTCRRLACFERAAAHNAFARVLRQGVRVDPALSALYTEHHG